MIKYYLIVSTLPLVYFSLISTLYCLKLTGIKKPFGTKEVKKPDDYAVGKVRVVFGWVKLLKGVKNGSY